MKVLVYGAGPLGSVYAAKLKDGGHEVSLLARGRRLADLRAHGIQLIDLHSGQETTTYVNIVENLAPEDAYDLVLVIMRKNRVSDILPILAANRLTPNVLFLMNNASGPGELVAALGEDRVMIGFPMAAGYFEGPVIHYTASREGRKAMVPIGEVDGHITPRLRQVGNVLATMPGFDADLRSDMDAWLKYHVALLMPSLAPALVAAGRDNVRLARTRDLVVLTLRAIKEGIRVLRSLGHPISLGRFKSAAWLPEPVLVPMMQRWFADPRMAAALRHGEAAHDEVKHLADEFLVLARQSGVPTPTIDRLYQYFDPATPPMPDGSASIPLDWRIIWAGTGGLALIVLLLAYI